MQTPSTFRPRAQSDSDLFLQRRREDQKDGYEKLDRIYSRSVSPQVFGEDGYDYFQRHYNSEDRSTFRSRTPSNSSLDAFSEDGYQPDYDSDVTIRGSYGSRVRNFSLEKEESCPCWTCRGIAVVTVGVVASVVLSILVSLYGDSKSHF